MTTISLQVDYAQFNGGQFIPSVPANISRCHYSHFTSVKLPTINNHQ